MKSLKPYIQVYISNWYDINDYENYKWEAVKHFQATFYNDSLPITQRTIQALSKHDNLLDSKRYYPLGMLIEVSTEKPDVMERLLNVLFDDSKPIRERVTTYISEFEQTVAKMADDGHSNWKGRNNLQSFQDIHAISVYLALHYPKTHYIYKFGIFKEFARIVDYKRKKTDKIDRFIEFYSLCEEVKKELLKEKEFVAEYKKWIKQHNYRDENYNLLTQDFRYAVAIHLNNDSYKKSDKKKSITSNTPQTIKSSHFSQIESRVSEKPQSC